MRLTFNNVNFYYFYNVENAWSFVSIVVSWWMQQTSADIAKITTTKNADLSKMDKYHLIQDIWIFKSS